MTQQVQVLPWMRKPSNDKNKYGLSKISGFRIFNRSDRPVKHRENKKKILALIPKTTSTSLSKWNVFSPTHPSLYRFDRLKKLTIKVCAIATAKHTRATIWTFMASVILNFSHRISVMSDVSLKRLLLRTGVFSPAVFKVLIYNRN